MKRVIRDERGMALALAIFALVVVGALVAGAFFAGRQEQRVGDNTRRLEQSFGVAEYGIANKMLTWRPDSINLRPSYPQDSIPIALRTTSSHSGTYGGWIRKLNDAVFMLDVVGSDTMSRAGRVFGGGARQRLGMISRLRPLDVDIQASLTTMGSVNLQGNAVVDGRDVNPTGWLDCNTQMDTLAGIRTDTGDVQLGGNGRVYGQPNVNHDATVGDSTFTEYGDVTYNELAAQANITLSGGTYQTQPVSVGGICDVTVSTNWGDGMNPTAPCGSYFPIIHITGSLTTNGVQGQGILLVDGDLFVQGSYEFYGLTIVLGDLKTQGGGNTEAHFWGGVMAQNADLSVQNLSGKATLNYSSCAVVRVLRATAMPSALRSRGWTQLF